MSTRIPVNTATAWGAALAEAVDAVLEARAKVARVKAAFESMASGATYAQVDAEVNSDGPTYTPDAVRGEAIYNTVVGANAALVVADVNALVTLDQG